MTRDERKTREELLQETDKLRCRVCELEQALQQLELRNRSLFESAPVGIGLATVEGEILEWNDAMLQMTGYSDTEIRQINLKDTYVNPKQRAQFLKKLQTDGIVRDFEVQLKRKDGTDYWANLTVMPALLDGNSNILTMAVDITERKKAEEEIKRLTSAVEQSIDGIAIGDLEPKLVYVNHAFARMHGYTTKEMLGIPATRLHKKQIDEYKRALNRLKTRGSWEGELGHTRKDGTTFPSYMSITLLKNDDGEATGTLAVARDITESKRRERELNICRERIAGTERLVSVGTLSATLAHELSQPLTVIRLSIQNSLEELQRMSCSSTTIEQLSLGLRGISNVTSIVGRFKDFARSSSGKNIKEVDLNAVAKNVMRLLDEKAWRVKTSLHVQGLHGLPPVRMDEKDLEQLFFALIQNAVQAADGRERHLVIVSGRTWDQSIELRFFDNCGGIAPENLDKIFEPFFTTKPAGEGTGLGLPIARRIVCQANGKISVETKHGEGTTFVVTLPVNGDRRS
jgi:PAS domain S-box-containing protein